VVSWQDGSRDGWYYGIFAQRFRATGAPIAAGFQVNDYTPENQVNPAVAVVPGGDFVLAWESESQDGSAYGIFGRRLLLALFADGLESGDACSWSAVYGGGCPLERAGAETSEPSPGAATIVGRGRH
jgi:hypothetical protein